MQDCACGFADDSVRLTEVTARSALAVSAIADLLRSDHDLARRPSDGRWSAIEYGAHVRDVLITIRDRTVVGLVEDDPTFTPMYRDQRIELGLYAADTGVAVATEIEAAQTMLARMFTQIDAAGLERTVRYGFPDPIHTTVGWMAKQAVHESEHHLADIAENLRGLAAHQP